MVRHYKWHKKRDESLQHGFMRYSPLDDCGTKFGPCTHNGRQTHYHCVQAGCDKVYISTSDVQMHANYHRKDSAIIQEGFQRFRATEDCGTTTCSFYGQRTTHFHCRRATCNFTFKNKADMEKHKSYHQKDEILGRDGFKKFMKYEHCTYAGCRFSKISNHIHCIRPGCTYVLHSTAQLYSHKRKHERREFESLYRTFRQAQRTTGLPVQPAAATTPTPTPGLVPAQTAARQLTSVANLPRTVVSTDIMTIPVQAIGQPMVAQRVVPGQVVQSLALPIQLGTTTAAMLARTTTSTMIAQPMPAAEAVKAASAISTPVAASTTSTPSQTGSNTATAATANTITSIKPFTSIKQEPESEIESDSDMGDSSLKSTGTSTTPLALTTKLQLKGEKLNDSLTLPIPGAPGSEGVKQEVMANALGSKVMADASIGVDTGGASAQMVAAVHRDRITPMVYEKYEALQACPQNCQLSLKEKHYHCNWTGCNHVIPDTGPTFARLEHYRIHEYAKAAAGKNYRMTSGQSSRAEDAYSQRRRGRPPKYPRMDVPLVPKVDLSPDEIQESLRQFSEGDAIEENAKIVNGFRKFEEGEACPDDQCMYYQQTHYHCGRLRCHTATDRVDVLNLHAKDFHSFVNILENFEFFDRNVNCRRSHCHNNQVNRHYHCIRPRCDYSFVRHSTMTQHDKKHGTSSVLTPSIATPAQTTTPALGANTRVTPIQWVKRPDGKAYIPIIPAIDPSNKNIVKAAGTFYPLSGLPGAVSLTPAPVGIATAVGGQQLATSTITLTIPANLGGGTIPVMAQTLTTGSPAVTSVVPVITTGNIVNAVASTAAGSAPPLTVLLQQKSGNGVPQPSWSAMRQSMHFSLQASCGRPFCKLKKKDHYHCLECNQAFSDPARLRSHISKHGVKFRKMDQGTRSIRPLPVTVLDSDAPAEVGLDLSTSKVKEEDGEENPEERDAVEADEHASVSEDQGDEEDSMASSLNRSISSISRILPREDDPSSPSMDASELNDDGALVIDEDIHDDTDQEASLQFSLSSSVDGKDDEEDTEAASETSDLNMLETSTSSIGSATTSRRSSRKRTAPVHADFINSDDAALAKQMKLKLSGPIPSTVSPGGSSSSSNSRQQIPEGFIRFHCSNDCGYTRCAYRQTVTHFHCLRSECGYGFSDKSRIIQHRLRHERIDKLMGDDFQQFRATVSCLRADCEFAEKASHFHCQKCAFVCADSSKVLAHRKYHTKMDNISSNGFKKFTGMEDCGVQMCTYGRKQTHYHCVQDSCSHAVLGPAQMAPHKLKHACHDV
nr:hypothetical protein BaRGS_017733 [Batillaria attramentaria]